MKVTLRLLALVLGLSLLAISRVQAEAAVTFYHHDALGSVIATSNQYGALDLNEEYQPYGEKIYQTEDVSSGNEDWYTGKNYSKELDLSYFGARWYDAKQGRFLSIDPAGVVFENLHSFNRYIYAYNNPYKYIDPDGLAPEAEDANGDGVPDIEEIETFTLGASKQFNEGTHRIAGAFLGGASGRDSAAKGTIPKNKSLSSIRQAGSDERFVRFESENLRFSRVTPESGLKPGTFAAPRSELPLPLSQRASRFNLPDPQIPRTRQLDIQAPGSIIVGPRPVSGGSGNEVLFPFGTNAGTVK